MLAVSGDVGAGVVPHGYVVGAWLAFAPEDTRATPFAPVRVEGPAGVAFADASSRRAAANSRSTGVAGP